MGGLYLIAELGFRRPALGLTFKNQHFRLQEAIDGAFSAVVPAGVMLCLLSTECDYK